MSSLVLGVIGLQLAITALVLGFTAAHSVLRLAALPLIPLCSYLKLPYIANIEYPAYRAILGGGGGFLTILYINKALLDRWSSEVKGPTSSLGGLTSTAVELGGEGAPGRSQRGGNLWERIRFGLSISLESRYSATRWPVKNIPPFSRKDPKYVLSKGEFFRQIVIKLIIYILILDLTTLAPHDDKKIITFSSDRIPFFTRLSTTSPEEIFARTLSVIAYWSISYVMIDTLYCVLALIAVLSGVTTINTWRPAFGSISDSYSIRQFWG